MKKYKCVEYIYHYSISNQDDDAIIKKISYQNTVLTKNALTITIKLSYDNPNIQDLFESLADVTSLGNRKFVFKYQHKQNTLDAFFRLIQDIDPLPLDALNKISADTGLNLSRIVSLAQKYHPRFYLPPSLPNEVVKGFNSEGYWDLIQSLPEKDRRVILKEIESPSIVARANTLKRELSNNQFIGGDLPNSRNMFLAALLCLQQNDITKNQLATLHLLNSAILTLYASPLMYFTYHYIKNKQPVRAITAAAFQPPDSPNKVKHRYYQFITDKKGDLNSLPENSRIPLIYQFFNFTESEIQFFNQEMEMSPSSEQFFFILTAPEIGCWSSLIFLIQDVLKCMRMLELLIPLNDNNFFLEKVMIVPTFTMFQAAINAKANTLGRTPVRLVPTYGYLSEERYARHKSLNDIPLSLYLPEQNPKLRYSNSKGQFRTTIDGYPYETAFGGAIHDVYHGFREMMMSENIALARVRLAAIAKYHFNNIKYPGARPMDNILIDGELIFSYPVEKNTIFSQSNFNERFGDLFYTEAVANYLHPSLKEAFIADMVTHKDEWLECFGLGKDDLRPAEQIIYGEIESSIRDYSSRCVF